MSRIEHLAEGVTLYLGDCREMLPILDKRSSLVSDPPYGMNYGAISGGISGRSKTAPSKLNRTIVGDDLPFDPTPWVDFRAVILWGGNHFASRLPDSRCWLAWDKREGGTSDDHADCELAWTNLPGPSRLHRQLWRGMVRRGEENISRGQERVHPMQKPAELMRWCLSFCGPLPIVDPFMGSGSTGVAAAGLGRPFTGIEIDPTYFDVACRRIDAATKQIYLFAAHNADDRG